MTACRLCGSLGLWAAAPNTPAPRTLPDRRRVLASDRGIFVQMALQTRGACDRMCQDATGRSGVGTPDAQAL